MLLRLYKSIVKWKNKINFHIFKILGPDIKAFYDLNNTTLYIPKNSHTREIWISKCLKIEKYIVI